MILLPALYVITPMDSFKTKLSKLDLDSELAEILCETVVLSYNRASTTEEDIIEVKLLFLMNLRFEYLSDKLYKKIFDEDLIKWEFFDKWWNINRYLEDESFLDIEERIDPVIASLVVETGNPRIDSWIKKMQNKI